MDNKKGSEAGRVSNKEYIKYFRLLLSLPFTLVIHCAFAQTILFEGKVIDRFSNKPIPYATIGVEGKSLGTVADENGSFRFTVPAAKVSSEEMIVVSSVGYKEKRITASSFQDVSQIITLAPVPVSLNQVTIKPRKVKTRTYGRTGNSAVMVASMFTENNLVSDELAREQGTVIKIDEEVLLKNFNMHVAFNRFKYVRFRLNIYSVKDGLPDESLLKEDIIFDVTERRGWVKVDLSRFQIFLQGKDKVAVTIQWLKSEAIEGNRKSFSISAVPLPTHSILTRHKSQDEWKEIKPGYLSFYLTADTYKGRNRNSFVEDSQEDAYILPDSLKYLKYLSSGTPENFFSKHPYGDSMEVGNFIDVNGMKLYYETYGKGEPLLLLHGNGQSIAAFSQQIEALSQHFKVIAVDTRAQGKSRDSTAGELSYDLFATDMKQLLDSLHLKQVNILGWSDGGNTALKMAIHYPEYVNKIAIMGANLFPDSTAIESELLELFKKHLHALKGRTDEQALNQARLLRLLLNEPDMTYEDMTSVTVPALVMAGEHDVILESHTKAIAESINGAELVIFKDASHYAPQEIPIEFNQQVLEFFLSESGR